MYNKFKYDNQVYNVNSPIAGATIPEDIEFNGFGLINENIIITRLLYEDGPTRDFNTQKVPRNDGELLVGDFWRRHVIRMDGVLKHDTAAELENFMDTFKKELSAQNANLDIKRQDGETRRFKATLVSTQNIFQQKRAFHLTFIPFTIRFQTLDSFGENPTLQSVSDELITSLNHKIQAINSGSARSKPIITLNFSAASGLTAIQIENETTKQIITATVNISAGDVLAIDSGELTFIKGATEIDYLGEFPELAPGVNTIVATLTGTSAQYTITVNHKNKYL